MSKLCRSCKNERDISEYYARDPLCKECRKVKVKERYYSKEGSEKIKQYEIERAKRPERIKNHRKYDAKWRQKNLEKVKAKNIAYKKKCKTLGIGEWSVGGKEKIRQRNRRYSNARYKSDIRFKLIVSLRNRISIAIKSNQKTGSAIKDLGCSIEYLKSYLEKQFKNGMTWQNHGTWHIDHIKPLSKFNLSNRKEYLEAVNYKNLQPLWMQENLKKGNSLTTSFL